MSLWVSYSLSEYLYRQLRNVCWYCKWPSRWSTSITDNVWSSIGIQSQINLITLSQFSFDTSHSQKNPCNLGTVTHELTVCDLETVWNPRNCQEELRVHKNESGKTFISWSTLDLSKIMNRLMIPVRQKPGGLLLASLLYSLDFC